VTEDPLLDLCRRGDHVYEAGLDRCLLCNQEIGQREISTYEIER
jgi:hypothetical protein